VPVREGTELVPPEHYGSWEDEYKRVTRKIRDDDESVTLARVLREMRTA
jgi:hypothetical protein